MASERSEGEALHALACDRLQIVTCDVTDPESYEKLGLADAAFDILLVNAGITGARHQDATQATETEIAEVMATNAFGPARAARTLLPTLKDGGTLAFMSSLWGRSPTVRAGSTSIGRARHRSTCSPRALPNSRPTRERSRCLRCIGWVQTDMGGPNATLTIDESVTGLSDVLESAGGKGFRYVDYAGEDLPF